MSSITLEGIAKLLAKLLKVELDPIKTRLSTIEKILEIHTSALEKLLTEKKVREDERIISADRFDRLEHWAVLVGNKLGIKLEL